MSALPAQWLTRCSFFRVAGVYGPEIMDRAAQYQGSLRYFWKARPTMWRALRDSEDSRYLGLTAPRFRFASPIPRPKTRIASTTPKMWFHSHEHYLGQYRLDAGQ